MCGICGFNGALNKKPNLDSLKILGILNEERGKDSAGIVLNNVIHKKGNKTTFRELVEDFKFNKNLVRGNVMIHTRAATIGSLIDENAHPYLFEEEGKPSMIFMHNGTIKNIDDLVKEYEVNVDGYLTDSRKLGKIIYEGHLDVLKKYTGAASICFYYLDNPESMYLWNGASQKSDNKYYYERGLYYTVLANKVMYFSSQKNHLKNALNSPEIILPVPYNTLCTFEKGELVNTVKYDRSHMRFNEYPYPFSSDVKTLPAVYAGYAGYGEQNNYAQSIWPFSGRGLDLTIVNNSYIAEFSTLEYFTKCVLPGHIFFNGQKYVISLDNKKLETVNGIYKLNNVGQISSKNSNLFYFLDGVMMKDEKSYNENKDFSLKHTGYENRRMLYKNSHKNTFYISGNIGEINSSYELLNKKIPGGFCSIPFSPFIFYILNSRVKGFIINTQYSEFFELEKMYKQLNKSDLTFYISRKTYPTFQSIVELTVEKNEKEKGVISLFNNSWDNYDRATMDLGIIDDNDDDAFDQVDTLHDTKNLFDEDYLDSDDIGVEKINLKEEISIGVKNALDNLEIDLLEIDELLDEYRVSDGIDAYYNEMQQLLNEFCLQIDFLKSELGVLN